ncbi:hypothetical protein CRG98_030810 [Punica granatum]|uniref:Uncharacterized protein n=1 Tax=Punica granatum TaxID=22663 RepID=A0A2I0IXP4_PUNGR|nr:hypothetical protein CRG98_030810 [Punica granatum]
MGYWRQFLRDGTVVLDSKENPIRRKEVGRHCTGHVDVLCCLGGTVDSTTFARDQESETYVESPTGVFPLFLKRLDASGDHFVIHLLKSSPEGFPRNI